MKDLAYYNGKITPAAEMTVPAEDRAFYFGDGIYDVTTVHGGKCFALDDHAARFYGNAQKLHFDLGLSLEELKALCRSLCDKLDRDVPEAVLYFQASRGTAPRSHVFPEGVKANLFFTLKPASLKPIGQEVAAITVEDRRFEFCDIKTLNLLPNCMAAEEAKQAGAYEAIFHRGETVTEGSHSGVSILKDGRFITPPLSRFILPSVSRKHYIELATALGIRVEERTFTVEEMRGADEIMIMSSTAPLNRCMKIDGTSVGGRDPERIALFAKAYAEKITAETGAPAKLA
ncbi:MAG: aminotransferase class IV [Clostridia bacterium]|nr:aminotransferase class IV [Clostridia bacterium]